MTLKSRVENQVEGRNAEPQPDHQHRKGSDDWEDVVVTFRGFEGHGSRCRQCGRVDIDPKFTQAVLAFKRYAEHSFSVKATKAGNSIALRLPMELARSYGVAPGEEFPMVLESPNALVLNLAPDVDIGGKQMAHNVPGPETTAEQIYRWLIDMNYYERPTSVEQADWGYVAKVGNLLINILKLKGEEDQLTLHASLDTQEVRPFLESLPRSEAMELLWKIRRDLVFQEPEFRTIPEGADVIPDLFEFQHRLVIPELTKGEFKRGLIAVFRCMRAVMMAVNAERHLSEIRRHGSADPVSA